MVRIIKNNLGNFLVICLIFLTMTIWIFSGKPQIWKKPAFPPEVQRARAAEVLTSGSFTGGITDWTVGYVSQGSGSIVGDSSNCEDSADSLKGTSGAGSKITMTGYASQGIGNINSTDTVNLQLQYFKRMVLNVSASHNYIYAQICKPSLIPCSEAQWVTIWSDLNAPAINGDPGGCPAGAWTDSTLTDVSVSFDENGTYNFRWYFDLKSGNNALAEALAWIDHASLDVVAGATYSVTINTSPITYGTVALGATNDTVAEGETQIVENNGITAAKFNIKGSNSANWTIITGVPTVEEYRHRFATESGTWTALDLNYQTLVASIAQGATQSFDLEILISTGTAVSAQQNVNVWVQAIQP